MREIHAESIKSNRLDTINPPNLKSKKQCKTDFKVNTDQFKFTLIYIYELSTLNKNPYDNKLFVSK